MIKSHPFQNVYFNALAGPNIKYRFDVDYWGLSSRQALQFIAQTDSRSSIKIWAGSKIPLSNGTLLLLPRDRNRFEITETEKDADYIITQYRLNLTDYGPQGKGYHPYYSVLIDGESIISVYKQ